MNELWNMNFLKRKSQMLSCYYYSHHCDFCDSFNTKIQKEKDNKRETGYT